MANCFVSACITPWVYLLRHLVIMVRLELAFRHMLVRIGRAASEES